MPAPKPEGELRRVEQLDGQPAADLHLALVEGHVHAGSAVGGPVADGVGAELARGAHRVVGVLPADFESFLRSGSTMKPEMAALAQGSEPCS